MLKLKREHGVLADALAEYATDNASQKELRYSYYDDVRSYTEDLTLEELVAMAADRGLEVEEVSNA